MCQVILFYFVLFVLLLNDTIFTTTCLQIGFIPCCFVFSLRVPLLVGPLNALDWTCTFFIETCTTVTKISKHKKASERNKEENVYVRVIGV